jgi:hypothetical protein
MDILKTVAAMHFEACSKYMLTVHTRSQPASGINNGVVSIQRMAYDDWMRQQSLDTDTRVFAALATRSWSAPSC